MPTASPYEQGVFRVNHPDVVAWCEAIAVAFGNGVSWNELLSSNGVLTEEEVTAVQTAILNERQEEPRHPAEEWHAAWIPNGDYTAAVLLPDDDDDDGVQRFDFRIHLVERGQLAGKRIIKVKLEGQSIYSGFAFVTRDGHLDLWRRFMNHANERYVLAAAALCQAITDGGSRGDARYVARACSRNRMVLSETMIARPGSIFGRDEAVTVEWRIRQMRCLHCNATAVDPMPGPFPLCTDHSRVPERERPVVNPEAARRITRRRRSEAPVSVGGPLMSEVTGKFVR